MVWGGGVIDHSGKDRRRARQARARARDQHGAVAVEFALVLPLLVALLLGVTTTGLSYTRAIGVSNAVREGARFGATADSTAVSWANDTINRVRATELDFGTTSPPATGICVQLWRKTGAGTGVQLAGACDAGAVSPAPTLATLNQPQYAVPSSVPDNACVVRVLAGRNFTINIALVPAWTRVSAAYSMARYERSDKVPACVT